MRLLPSALLIVAAVGAPLAAGEGLSVRAELPMSGPAGSLASLRLARDGPWFLVSVTGTQVQSWRIGSSAEPGISSGGGSSPAFADFDGDGALDLAVLGPGSPSAGIVFLRGDGSGAFTPVATLGFEAPEVLAAGDVDADGLPDLIVGKSPAAGTRTFSAFRSLGGFRFAGPVATDTGWRTYFPISGLTAVDVDGDGRADLVMTLAVGGVSVWRSAGDWTFALSSDLGGYHSRPPALADLDGDGRLDLVYADTAPGLGGTRVIFYRNAGGGLFHLVSWMERFFSGLTLADVNRDGSPDLVGFGYGTAPFLSVLPNDGHAAFGAAQESLLPDLFPDLFARDAPVRGLVAVDWEADGRLDFAVMTSCGPVVFGPAAPVGDIDIDVGVLLSVDGLLGSRFDSDLLLTNSGVTRVHAAFTYTATAGGGSGTVERDIEPGAQHLSPSALDFLRDAGLPIATTRPLVGTLQITASGGSTPAALRATVRTTSPTGAGVSFAGTMGWQALREDSVIPWLVENGRDRTNLALVNAGRPEDGPLKLSVTVSSGDPAAGGHVTLPDVVLEPGAFFQFGRVLQNTGFGVGWAQIRRAAGHAPYLAWAALNDAGSGDGSVVPAVPDSFSTGEWIVPSVVQSDRYTTELIVTNPDDGPVSIRVTLGATGTILEETVAAHQVFYLPDLFAELRRRGLAGAPAEGVTLASPLSLRKSSLSRALIGARVSTRRPGNRYYGVFEPGVLANVSPLVVTDLRQDDATRTNLGIANLLPRGQEAASFRLEVFDGESGRVAASREAITIPAGESLQINSVLRDLAPSVKRGWARVVSTTATPFTAYAVVMDGATPGQGTDDGSFIAGLPR